MTIDSTAEEKIKNAARALFTQKGYAATTTRDIADKAEINLALVNYYFRSKEKLFQLIMMESLGKFFNSIQGIFTDFNSTLQEKFELLAERYIEQIKHQPDTPMFILSELRARPTEFIGMVSGQIKFRESVLYRQLIEEIGMERLTQLNPLHVIMNLMSMIVFPFVAKPMLQRVAELEDQQFEELMDERKRLIPIWVMQTLR